MPLKLELLNLLKNEAGNTRDCYIDLREKLLRHKFSDVELAWIEKQVILKNKEREEKHNELRKKR